MIPAPHLRLLTILIACGLLILRANCGCALPEAQKEVGQAEKLQISSSATQATNDLQPTRCWEVSELLAYGTGSSVSEQYLVSVPHVKTKRTHSLEEVGLLPGDLSWQWQHARLQI